ncbi:MAG: sugar phosphate isomerase/epimerase [Acidobacteriota bacterium]|nr:MAG: sugar phosphate isomerase/epimerase [Acidobacteriota bacterium]
MLSRRTFIQGMAATAVASAAQVKGAQSSRPIRLGGPAFAKSDDPADIAQAHLDLGYRAAYAPSVKLEETDKIKAIVKEFADRDIVIAEVGAWVNLLASDPATRKKNLDFVTENLALAEALGARCCVDIAGSYHPTVWYGPHPDNFSRRFFDETVENCRKIIDAVKPTRTKFSIEMMGWCMPSTPDQYLELIRAVDREAFGVHVDVCNMINSPERIYNNATLIRECFEKLGKWAVSCHAKDVAWVPDMQVNFKEVIPGTGELDYGAYLSELAKLPNDVPLMMEHLAKPEEYKQAADYIRGVAGENGIAISS